MSDERSLLNLRGLSRRVRLPIVWLRAEAEAERIPALRVGKQLLFNAEAVERVLLERAAGTQQTAPDKSSEDAK